jgi:hypothetical protein
VLKADARKQTVPNLACVDARGQKVVDGLVVLGAQSTVGAWLKPVALTALRCPRAAMQS